MTITEIKGPARLSLSERQSNELIADLGGDSAAQLAALLFLASKERSSQAREQRTAAEARIEEANHRQVSELHKAADDEFYNAVINGGAQITAGAIGIAGAASSGDGAKPASGAANDGAAKYAAGAADGVKGAGQIAGAPFKYDAANHTANATESENLAEAQERGLDQVADDLDEAREQRKFVLDFLQATAQSKAQADQAPWQVRA